MFKYAVDITGVKDGQLIHIIRLATVSGSQENAIDDCKKIRMKIANSEACFSDKNGYSVFINIDKYDHILVNPIMV